MQERPGMPPGLQVVVAPEFFLPGTAAERLLLADGAGWRPLSEGEGAEVAPEGGAGDRLDDVFLLFALPKHLQASFWAMLEQAESNRDFDALAVAVAEFLTFKQLPPPPRAVFELVLQGATGTIERHGLWAVVNLSDDPVVLGVPGLRMRLGAAEGSRLPQGIAVEVLPPPGELPAVLLLVRRP